MGARQETCTFTGHRPDKLPWGFQEEDVRCVELKRRIDDAVDLVYQNGFRRFLCGMAMGCDFFFCESILSLRERYGDVWIEAAIPCPTQPDGWPPDQQERYRRLAAACDLQTVVSQTYTPACMLRRDRYMVDHASLLIAAFDGTQGGTRYTVEYALRQGVRIMDLHIRELY